MHCEENPQLDPCLLAASAFVPGHTNVDITRLDNFHNTGLIWIKMRMQLIPGASVDERIHDQIFISFQILSISI